ncbi:MAG: methionine--tRNA ligase [Candidatus Krumholzibacteriia bacterium]
MQTYYVTTAIDYVNARPHLGTAYEKIGADCLARYKRLAGFDTYFLMGTDEHSTNVEKEARRLGKSPQDYCREMASEFERVWARLNISYDQFIRTEDPRHVTAVQSLFQTIYDNGYIYQGAYEGYYCVSCEEFKLEKDLVDGLCPRHEEKPEWLEEENYFFALSKFGARLKQLLTGDPEFARPAKRRNELMNVIDAGLEDVSVSRSGKEWGVPLPVGDGQVVYVWFDALINYISALGFGGDDDERFKKYWPADCHVIGKDITRFHCLIWPAMLMAAGLPVPKSVFGHGFVYSRGTKMSKTLGNILDPIELAEYFGSADVLRYLLLREIAFDRDGDFTIEQAITRYNAELANELGNLFSRALSMVQRYRKGAVPGWDAQGEGDYARLTEGVVEAYRQSMDALAFDRGLAALWKAIQGANRYVEEKKPWELARGGDPAALDTVLRVLLEVLRLSSILCIPFMPTKAVEMREQLGLEGRIETLSLGEAESPGDTGWKSVNDPAPLFPKMELPAVES